MRERQRIQRKREKATALPSIQNETPQHSPFASQQDVDQVPSIIDEVVSSSGQPLDAETRTFMEPRFGHDFSKVRIHADGEAATAARNINATAYTVGQDIVFDSGQYQPETNEGKHLLAHELAHVVQQSRAGLQTPPPIPAHSLEQAAQQAASIVALGGTAHVEGASSVGIARQPLSLNESLDPTSMSDADLEREIALIQQWLSENQASSPERDQLTSTLSTMETEAAQRNGQQSPASTNQGRQLDGDGAAIPTVLAAGMLSPQTPLWPTTPPPGTIPDSAWNQWPKIPGEGGYQSPTTQIPDAVETAAPETAETIEATEMATAETTEATLSTGTAVAETAETAAVVAETAETAAVVAETAETAAVVGGAVEGGGLLAAIGGTLAAIPVAGWIALGVGAAALGGYLLYQHYHSSDGQVSANPNNTPVQLPGKEGQNPAPVLDPTTGEPIYTPGGGDYTPAVDPVTGEPIQVPGNQSGESMEAARSHQNDLPLPGVAPGPKFYIAPKGARGDPSQAWDKEENGFRDANRNIWRWDKGMNDHWDVQHPNGSHTNVNPDGSINHGPDNFP